VNGWLQKRSILELSFEVAPVKYLPEAQYSWQVTVEREKLIGILVFLCSLNSALIW
jgi:hypothetical protein